MIEYIEVSFEDLQSFLPFHGPLAKGILQERILAYNLTVIYRDASWREEPRGEVAELILGSINHQRPFIDESH